MGATAIIPAIGAAVQGGQAISSGVKGNKAAKKADQRLGQFEQATDSMMDTAMGGIGGMNNMMAGFNPGSGGMGDQMWGMGQQAGRDIQGMQGFQGFDFGGVNQIQGQAQQNALDFSQRQRDEASEQAGLAMRQGGDAVSMMMADRGMSGGGQAAAAMAGLGREQAQQMVGLNRNLADQAGQQALGAAQFDVSSGLQNAGMQSQYNLGANQQQWAQGMEQATGPLGIMQNLYQQNHLQPQMQMAGNMAGLYGGMMGNAMQGNMAAIGARGEQVNNAGSGKGAATGGALEALPGLGSAIKGT